MACSMLSRLAVAKISGACRFVISSVLLGGEGCESAGRSERSKDRLCEFRRRPGDDGKDGFDIGGVIGCIAVAAAM